MAEFQTTAWREAYAGLVPAAYLARTGVDERAARWQHRIVGGARDVALAERDSALVGVVSWVCSGPPGLPSLELTSLYVGAGERGRGTGRLLLGHALGDEPAFLWVFLANVRAQRFYAAAGFEPDGTTRTDLDTGLPEARWVRLTQLV